MFPQWDGLAVAGRTDTGVHARGQVAHFDLAKPVETDTIRDGLNAHLRPESVAILLAESVADGFDARYSAIRRYYRYRILLRRAPPVIDRGRVWHIGRKLDAAAMHDAAQRLIGTHDFTTFRAAAGKVERAVLVRHRTGESFDLVE